MSNMIIKRGSQFRELLAESGYHLSTGWYKGYPNSVILENEHTHHRELWTKRNDYAGYVIVINSVGYEFVREVS